MASQERQNGQLGHWQKVLALSNWEISLEKISPLQVTNESGKPNNSFVGVRPDGNEGKRAILFHTRKLDPRDIVHELLHLVHPEWSHGEIETEAQRLIRKTAFPTKKHSTPDVD